MDLQANWSWRGTRNRLVGFERFAGNRRSLFFIMGYFSENRKEKREKIRVAVSLRDFFKGDCFY